MSPRLSFAIETAMKAGRLTLAHFQTGAVVDLKSDSTPVTIADRAAERLMREEIGRAFPGDSILGEEEGAQGDGAGRWVMDPIDGTKSFISGVPLYATLLAYECFPDELDEALATRSRNPHPSSQAHRPSPYRTNIDRARGEAARVPVLGVCYFPALDELLYAELGQGAFWNGRPARVSQTPGIQGSVIVSGSMGTMARSGRLHGYQMLEAKAMAARTWSDAYGHALVATGRVAAMIDPVVARWDISAMAVIVREAGGRFTDFNGNDELAEEAISSNGLVHDEVLEAFRP